jgi:DNA-binding IclR family transcriptional regulator
MTVFCVFVEYPEVFQTRGESMRDVMDDTSPAQRDFRLPAVDRAMSLFELLAEAQTGLTLSQLSRKLDIPKSTAHYLLHTLQTRGYVQRSADGRQYSLGLRFADVARGDNAELSLRTLAVPYLRQIVARLDLTAKLAIRRSAEAAIVARVESRHDEGGGAWVGRHVDLHCTAQGKALIIDLSQEELNKLFAGRELARFTSKTICSLSALKVHLTEIRARGYAVNDEEMVSGVRAVAAPVVDSSGAVIASVTVRGTTRLIPTHLIAQLGREMILVSREISQRMSSSRI